MITFFLALDAISTKPGDLVDLLHARAGRAFVPETQSPFLWDFRRARRDEASLGNFARRAWALNLPGRGGGARGETVPIDRLFEQRVLRISRRTEPKLAIPTTATLRRRGGVRTTVADLLTAARIPVERCHWLYRGRRFHVRVDLDRLEEGMEDLGRAIGARYAPGTKSLEFDPAAFRTHVRNSLPERLAEDRPRGEFELALVRLSISKASDQELASLFATPDGTTTIPLAGMTPEERRNVDLYFRAAFRVIDAQGDEQGPYLRSRIDFARLPSVSLSARGVARLTFLGPDGRSRVHL